MTDRLYYTDATLLRFQATVTGISPDGLQAWLDRTAFYPTSGGQPHDTGILAGTRVVDVVDGGDRIVHVLDRPIGARVGEVVEGTIDADRRRDHMQQHSGQHLLSALFADLCGAETASVHFGAETSLLELDVETLTESQLRDVESRANRAVAAAIPVTVSFEDAAGAEGLRKASAREGTLRIVSIGELDRSACGGTHVTTSAEIGAIVIRGLERMRKRVRVEFVCGERALERARRDHALLASAAKILSAAPADVPTLVSAQAARLRALDAERRALLQEAAGARASQLHAATRPDRDGIRRILEREADATAESMRGTANAIPSLPSVLYAGATSDPPFVIFAASADTGVDAGKSLQAALREHGGRGGGSPRVGQGTLPGESEVEAVIARLLQPGTTDGTNQE